MDNLPRVLKTTFDPYFEAPIQIWTTFAEKGEVIDS
jgi:hypothetical protein